MADQAKEQIKSFVSGGVGGMSLVLVGHPLDTIKVRLQTSNEYTGMMDCFRKTVAKDGIFGLYRGMAAPLVSVSPIFAVYFWGFDLGKDIAAWFEKKEDRNKISTAGVCFAGGFSAIPGSAVMIPGDRIKVLLQIQGQSTAPPKYKGPIDCAIQLIKSDGLFNGLFKGTILTLFRDVPGSVAYYAGYEVFKEMFTPKGEKGLSPLAVVSAGGMAGVCNWIVSVPPDVLKSRYQTAAPGRYTSIMHVFTDLIKNEGIGALYKGIVPALARAFPANAACFLGVEVSKKIMNTMF